ncbi:class I SAM-dependent methyltransferase [Tessaracoccus sp.]|uniref:class I SAM-dependent methyltransferase n=1 Tax=Tessaracoccus sp. TaxID=1971211 RepID=UPI0026308395|nr:methyltransferase [Tessaracoccus sp.]
MRNAATGMPHAHEADGHAAPHADPVSFWEARYSERDQIWSGRVNAVLADAVASLPPGRALDLGCGEGGDVVWLAEQGWDVVGVDISPTAVNRGQAAARSRRLTDRVHFLVVDLSDTAALGEDLGGFDLVAASFLQSPMELDRARILRAGAALVAPGGHLLVTSHAAPPPWASSEHLAAFRPITPESELTALGLDPTAWETVVAEIRTRVAVSPDGERAELLDCVVLIRRAA